MIAVGWFGTGMGVILSFWAKATEAVADVSMKMEIPRTFFIEWSPIYTGPGKESRIFGWDFGPRDCGGGAGVPVQEKGQRMYRWCWDRAAVREDRRIDPGSPE